MPDVIARLDFSAVFDNSDIPNNPDINDIKTGVNYPVEDVSYYSDDKIHHYIVKNAGRLQPPWSPLAKEYAPHLVYEDMNQEFPTSIFFDGDRDMSNNGIPKRWPDGSSRSYPYGDIYFKDMWIHDFDRGGIDDVKIDDVNITGYYPEYGEFYGSLENPISWIGDDVKVGTINFDSANSYFPYWADANFDVTLRVKYKGQDTYDYISASISTDEAEIDLIDQDTFSFYSSPLKIITSDGNVWVDFNMEGDITSHWVDKKPYMGNKYYQKTLSQKKESTCVYMQAYEKDDLLGIQYWFYYPFHDDPSGDVTVSGGNVHQHDWWYFWIVYDTDSKQVRSGNNPTVSHLLP
ncbi:MAG: hypothetical protein R6U61_00300 [Thermoplasmata archaeon]